MKVKIFDERTKKELEKVVNEFTTRPDIKIKDVKYSLSMAFHPEAKETDPAVSIFSTLITYSESGPL